MDIDEMAAALAYELNKDCWKAEFGGVGEVFFTNEDGEKFVLAVSKVDSFPDSED